MKNYIADPQMFFYLNDNIALYEKRNLFNIPIFK